jgi:hypothetical protein
MKCFHHLLLLVVIGSVSFGQESSNVTPVVPASQSATQEVSRSSVSVRPLGQVSDSAWQAMAAARSKQPLCILTITNDVSQDSILTITDDVNGHHGIDRYVDVICGTGGARLSRDYVGHGFLVTVAFAWDQRPKKTIFSLYGTNIVAGKTWRQDMTSALHKRFGSGNTEPKAQR